MPKHSSATSKIHCLQLFSDLYGIAKIKTRHVGLVCLSHDRTPKLPVNTDVSATRSSSLRLYVSRHDLFFVSFFLPTMPSRSPTPNTSHEVLVVQAILSFRTQPIAKKDATKNTKKSSVPKGKTESKTKEMKFTFESSEENYLSFLSELLKVHGHDKYTPVKKHCRFGIKVSVAKKAYVSNCRILGD